MNPDPSKLRHQHQEEQTAKLHQTQQRAGIEFVSVEELIRYDAAQTPPPPAIAERLNESTAREPKPARSWWKRFFSGSDPG